GAAASPHQEGEILARGPNVFTGYHNLPDKTAEVLTGAGWFRTGDLGYFDDAGYLYVTGRISTLIKTEGGEKVQVEELEETFLKSPALREIGVLRKENRPVALVVPKNTSQDATEEGRAIATAIAEGTKGLPSSLRIADYAAP